MSPEIDNSVMKIGTYMYLHTTKSAVRFLTDTR